LNFTRTSETIRRPAKNSLTPYNEQLTPPFPLCGQLSLASWAGMAGHRRPRRSIDGWNDRHEPFTWAKAAGEILAEPIRKELRQCNIGA
jgi:hypothetical protein